MDAMLRGSLKSAVSNVVSKSMASDSGIGDRKSMLELALDRRRRENLGYSQRGSIFSEQRGIWRGGLLVARRVYYKRSFYMRGTM